MKLLKTFNSFSKFFRKKSIIGAILMIFHINYSNANPNNLNIFNEIIGQFNEKKSPNFVNLDDFGFKTNKPNMFLRKEVAEKLMHAYLDFKKIYPDIPFIIVSATRNYDYQKGIWTRKWNETFPKYNNPLKTAKNILRFSSMPGTSRHHWGTDVDITSLDSSYFLNDPKGQLLFSWLTKNMPKYGFCQPYSPNRNSGYYTEEWHWSYQPIASKILMNYKNLMEKSPQEIIKKLDFIGAKELPLEQLIKEYVFSISTNCL